MNIRRLTSFWSPGARLLMLAWLAAQPVFGGTPGAQAPQTYIDPGRTIREQITYMKKGWPQQFGVVVVEALEPPKPALEQDGVAYYFQAVRAVDWIFVRWFHPDPQGPGERFKIHYWVRPKRGEKPLEAKRRGIAFIAPARAQGIYVTEMILVASQDNVFEVRRAMIETVP